ncbi:Hypothetical predicted protein [Podarcis lilfordi]|uniref:Uncharacterized protein n=1 Tax=Podarcis lilfordi TaxID=74358 RepID=A0AA35LBF4_9SAUR|nr:Hypothetical predicted protein [Podarcis lilfordi]
MEIRIEERRSAGAGKGSSRQPRHSAKRTGEEMRSSCAQGGGGEEPTESPASGRTWKRRFGRRRRDAEVALQRPQSETLRPIWGMRFGGRRRESANGIDALLSAETGKRCAPTREMRFGGRRRGWAAGRESLAKRNDALLSVETRKGCAPTEGDALWGSQVRIGRRRRLSEQTKKG